MSGSSRILRNMGIDVDNLMNPPARKNDLSNVQSETMHNFNLLFELINDQQNIIDSLEKRIKSLESKREDE